MATVVSLILTLLSAPAEKVPPYAITAKLPESMTVEIEYKVELPKPAADARVAQVWIPIPRDSEAQRVNEVRSAGPITSTRDPETGNRFAYYEFKPASTLPAELVLYSQVERKTIRMDKSLPTPPKTDEQTLALWLAPNRLLPIDGAAKTLSEEVTKGLATDLEKARKIYDYVFDHMQYDKTQPGWGNADFARACEVGKGNCTDFHGLFLSLCRAQNIPARFEIGVEFATDGSTQIPGGYHCWASFFTREQGWVPVDISTAWKRAQQAKATGGADAANAEKSALFGTLDAYRVTFTQGLDIQTAPKSSELCRYIIDPVVEIDGKRIAAGSPHQGGFRRTWSYRFLSDPKPTNKS